MATRKIPTTNLTEEDKLKAASCLEDDARIALSDFIRLSKEDKKTFVSADKDDVRFIVQAYYQIQETRIVLASQLRSIEQGKSVGSSEGEDKVPHTRLLRWLYMNFVGIESEIKKALDIWSDNDQVASWCKKVMGIGPVISSGLAAYFDIKRAPSASHFISYAGLNDNNNPWYGKGKADELVKRYCKKTTVTTDDLVAIQNDPDCTRSYEKLLRYAWDEKKQKYTRDALIKGLSKIPYNKDLKVLLWKVGESFVKVSNKPTSLYGAIYKLKVAEENRRNDAGELADQAAYKLANYNIGKNTEAYKYYSVGKLPPAHIHARATRYAEKIFVCHLFEEMYRVEYNSIPPRPYAIAYLGHVDIIQPEVPYTEIDPNKRSVLPVNTVGVY